MSKFKINKEFQKLLPPLSESELLNLERSLIKEGCREPLTIWKEKNILLDGHHRHKLCTKHKIPYKTRTISFKDPVMARIWARNWQLSRRNLPPGLVIDIQISNHEDESRKASEREKAGRGADGSGGRGKKRNPDQISDQGFSREPRTHQKIAKVVGVSHDTVQKVITIRDRAESGDQLAKEVRDKMHQGELTINAAYNEVKREDRKQERVEKIKALSSPTMKGKMGKFPVIYADPPWKYEHSISDSRKIENQYPTMDLKEICKLPIEDISTKDSILFLWTTSPKLAESIQVIEAWGFTYKTCMVWLKDKIGMGYYARQKHELLLIATRGNPPTPDPKQRPHSVIEAKRGKHSEKPDKFYSIIEKMYPEFSKLELFARNKRKGWESWGNQV